MEAIFFALISFVGWGISDLFVTINARKLNAYSSAFWTLSISVLLLSLYTPFATDDLGNLTKNIFVLNLFLGFVFMTGIVLFREALIAGSSPVMAAITASHAALTTILSIIFFQEKLNFNQQLAIIIIFAGLFLSLLDVKQLSKGKVIIGKGTVFALMAAAAFGIYFTFIKIPVREIGWFWPNYFFFLFFTPVIFLYIKFRKIKLNKPTYNKAFLPLFLGTILGRVGELGFNLAVSKGYTSVVAPIAGSSPILFVILAAVFLKDATTKQQIIGIVTTLLGVILLSAFSV